MTVRCLPKREKKVRTLFTLTIDPEVLVKVKEFMRSIGEDNLSAFTEGLYLCVMRDTCEGCPAYDELPEEEKAKVTGKGAGVGKWE